MWCALISLVMNLTCLPVGYISHTILQYSKQASAAQVHNDLQTGGRAIKGPAPGCLDLVSTSSSRGKSDGRAMVGP